MEEWRDVVGYEGLYMVSNEGRVKSLARTGLIMTRAERDGYFTIKLTKDKRAKSYYIHALVAGAFIGLRPVGSQIDHIDRNRKNNLPINLRYATPSANSRNSHRSKHLKYTGVYYNSKRGTWYAQVGHNKKKKFLGTYAKETDAAKAYDKYVVENNLDRELNNA